MKLTPFQVGVTINKAIELEELKVVPTVRYCKLPCDEKTPCVRICEGGCGNQFKSHVLNSSSSSSTCTRMSHEVEKTLFPDTENAGGNRKSKLII